MKFDAVDQAREDLQGALADVGAALRRAGDAYERLCALAGDAADHQHEEASTDLDLEPEWMNFDEAAAVMGVSRSTIRRWAEKYGARWPFGNAQQVNIALLRHLRPPREKKGQNER